LLIICLSAHLSFCVRLRRLPLSTLFPYTTLFRSLKSEKSFGVGDFGDLKRMVDWAVYTHQKVIQILPINDTTMTHTWTDSYPYRSEEHTSELQSRFDLVCRLLLEKKKKQKNT